MARTQTIEQLRQRIAALTATRVELTNAPCALAESREEIERWCAAQATIGDSRIGRRVAAVRHGGDLNDVLKISAFTAAATAGMGAPIDLAPMLASVFGPVAMAEILCRHLPADDNGVTVADRTARIQEIDRELDTLENDEETFVVASELTARPIARRGDARPEIVLAVRP